MKLSSRLRPPRLFRYGLAGLLLFTACSIEDSLPAPDCSDGGSGLIVAQSVPTASSVPCFDGLPDGWETSSVEISQVGTTIRFDSDRAGRSAAELRFSEECETGPAVQTSTGPNDSTRWEYIERVVPGLRAERYHLFDGGCLRWIFDFNDGAPAGLAVELADNLALLTRAELNQNIRDSFIDEEL